MPLEEQAIDCKSFCITPGRAQTFAASNRLDWKKEYHDWPIESGAAVPR